jgi:hypothetical protein
VATTNVAELLGRLSERELMPYLVAHIRQMSDAAETVELSDENWKGLAAAHASTPVQTKLQKLLEYVGRHSNIGQLFYILNEAKLAAAADLRDPDELKFVLQHLRDSRLIEYGPFPAAVERRNQDGSYELETAVRLTVEGWNAIAPSAGGVPGTCFVAMSFARDLEDAFRLGIRPAIEQDCGFRAIRVDKVPHNREITDQIIAGIRGAQFVVADFTGHRQGVYYEAGFAQGLGRPVVRTCHARDFGALHFDTRQFVHLEWSEPNDLRDRLAAHVRATIGTFGGSR